MYFPHSVSVSLNVWYQEKVLFSKGSGYSVISSLLAEVCVNLWCRYLEIIIRTKNCSNVTAYICRQLFIFLKVLACYFKHLFLEQPHQSGWNKSSKFSEKEKQGSEVDLFMVFMKLICGKMRGLGQ